MTEFKALVVIFDEVQTTVNGFKLADKLGTPKRTEAENGLRDAAAKISKINPNVKFTYTIHMPGTYKILKYLGLTTYPGGKDSPILHAADFEKAIKVYDPGFSLKLREYDTYFVVVPATNARDTVNNTYGLLSVPNWAVTGWGGYNPKELMGGASAFISANHNMQDFDGQFFIHEWLHGVCQFYKNLGWTNTISSGDADDAGKFGYTKSTSSGDLDYYTAMMTASLLDKTQPGQPPAATPGITNAIWNSGSIRSDFTNMFASAEIKNIYINEGGFAKLGYPVSTLHKWKKDSTTDYDLELIDFNGPAGKSAIMRVPGVTSFRYVPTGWFDKYADYTGALTIGGPVTAPAAWNGGQIMEFKRKDGVKVYMIKSPSGSDICPLPSDWYNRYITAGGHSVLGFPCSDAHTWEKGTIVDFKKSDGTSCALMKPDGSSSIYYLPSAWWEKFKSSGGAFGVGYPSSDVTTASGVEYMTFTKSDGSVSALIKQMDNGSIHYLPAEWYTAYKKAGGAATVGYPYNNGIHTWSDGEILDLKLSNGKQCALMKPNYGRGNGIVQYLHNALWEKYKAVGGATAIGYPYSDWHSWGSGMIMDFAPKSGYDSAIMQETGYSSLYHVKGLVWLAYKNTSDTSGSGARSYLGYPRSDEYTWKDGLFGWWGTEYHRSDFKGGWCWASKTDGNKYGNDKNFNSKK